MTNSHAFVLFWRDLCRCLVIVTLDFEGRNSLLNLSCSWIPLMSACCYTFPLQIPAKLPNLLPLRVCPCGIAYLCVLARAAV